MLSTMFRRTLLRTPRFTPSPIGCMSSIGGAAYPRGLPPSLAAVQQELGHLLQGVPQAPTAAEISQALRRASSRTARYARELVKRGENIINSMGNAYETALLTLEFNNTNLATIGDATGLRGSSTPGSFYVGLHTADPGEAGDATTSEATFTGYGRQAVARSSGGWTISGNSVSNAAAITFGQNSGSDQTVGFFSISAGTDGAGAETVVRYGPLIASGATWLPFTAKTDDTITIPSNPFSVDDRIVLAAAYDGALPTGTTQGTIYWVKTVSSNDITISTTQGGSVVDITVVGSGVCIKAKPLSVRGGIDSVQFAIGTLVSKID